MAVATPRCLLPSSRRLALLYPDLAWPRPASSSPTTGQHEFRLSRPPAPSHPAIQRRAPSPHAPIKPELNPGPSAGAVPSKNTAIGPWRASAFDPVELLPHVLPEDGDTAVLVLIDATGRVATPTWTGSPWRIPAALSFLPPLHDSIVCGVRVLLDAGRKGEREYLDGGGGLLADWRIPVSLSSCRRCHGSLCFRQFDCVRCAWCSTSMERGRGNSLMLVDLLRWIYQHYVAMLMALVSLTMETKGQPGCSGKQMQETVMGMCNTGGMPAPPSDFMLSHGPRRCRRRSWGCATPEACLRHLPKVCISFNYYELRNDHKGGVPSIYHRQMEPVDEDGDGGDEVCCRNDEDDERVRSGICSG